MIKMFFDPFNAVNTNDQYRQGILRLEERWKTNSWATRAINNPWRHFHKQSPRHALTKRPKTTSFTTVKNDMDQLVHRLIFNPYLVDEQREPPPSSR
jgi:uncharacterized membrane protein YheB (UPF0754 family)